MSRPPSVRFQPEVEPETEAQRALLQEVDAYVAARFQAALTQRVQVEAGAHPEFLRTPALQEALRQQLYYVVLAEELDPASAQHGLDYGGDTSLSSAEGG